jgi:hypothetical protein
MRRTLPGPAESAVDGQEAQGVTVAPRGPPLDCLFDKRPAGRATRNSCGYRLRRGHFQGNRGIRYHGTRTAKARRGQSDSRLILRRRFLPLVVRTSDNDIFHADRIEEEIDIRYGISVTRSKNDLFDWREGSLI